jgi:hypothetical protein
VSQWLAGKAVPAERCYPIERCTVGAVCRWDLRPADWWEIWPELINAKGAPTPPDLLTPITVPGATCPPASGEAS